MEIIGDAEALQREILEMARRESAEIIASAEAEADMIMSSAKVAAGKARSEIVESALAGAARRRELLLAAVPAEAGRLQAARREALLDSIKEDAARMLPGEAAASGKAAILAELAAQAVSRMEGENFVISVDPADRAEEAGLPAEIELLAGRGPLRITIEESPGLGGGVIVRDAEGRQYWDNSFKARLERRWPELRGRLLQGAGAPGEGK